MLPDYVKSDLFDTENYLEVFQCFYLFGKVANHDTMGKRKKPNWNQRDRAKNLHMWMTFPHKRTEDLLFKICLGFWDFMTMEARYEIDRLVGKREDFRKAFEAVAELRQYV